MRVTATSSSVSWHAAFVLATPDPAVALDYQRSIVASVIELLEGFQARLPTQPAEFDWNGMAQRAYGEELLLLREDLWQLHSLLTEASTRLAVAYA